MGFVPSWDLRWCSLTIRLDDCIQIVLFLLSSIQKINTSQSIKLTEKKPVGSFDFSRWAEPTFNTFSGKLQISGAQGNQIDDVCNFVLKYILVTWVTINRLRVFFKGGLLRMCLLKGLTWAFAVLTDDYTSAADDASHCLDSTRHAEIHDPTCFTITTVHQSLNLSRKLSVWETLP